MNSNCELKFFGSGAIGARTARACDSCMQRRARWFCVADDAFLCQQCDVSVHSANALARRHERVRLDTASSSTPMSLLTLELGEAGAPAWVNGLKRKARTPRKKAGKAKQGLETQNRVEPLVVPDLETLLGSGDDDDGLQNDYQVPIFEAELLAELNSPICGAGDEPLDQFSDIEALLGRGLDDESFCLDELELKDKIEHIKVELELGEMDASTVDGEAKTGYCQQGDVRFDVKFDDDDDEKVEGFEERKGGFRMISGSSDLILKLNYEAVIAAWSSRNDLSTSPWTDGLRPILSPHEIVSNCFSAKWGVGNVEGNNSPRGNGREARVTRYREKRQTRLFSKRIRYEVRKLNAEKRPRMKGRFVKRTISLLNS